MGRGLSDDRAWHVAAAVALFGAITAWRFADADPLAGIGFLYVVPISGLAVRFGLGGGFAGAAAAWAMTIWWAQTHGPISPEGYFTRGTAFFAVAAVVGWQVRVRAREREVFEAQLLALATEDKLTGLPNRRGWDERAVSELQRAARSGRTCALAMIDLDGLKALNDTQGHAAGDRLLIACASAWSGAIREIDFLARLGGDEFALLMPECEPEDAADVVARMRFAMRKGYGFSAGIAASDGHEDLEALMERADAALYEAKRAGRGVTRLARARQAAGT